ncbi:MAG: hypothetical protein U0165_04715 [Polyangiaceae bacterium]
MDDFRPPGSDAVIAWASRSRLGYQVCPDLSWYSEWEPFDTIVAPSRYFNAVELYTAGARVVLVEPWSALGDMTPLGRSLFAFVRHNGLRYRASARIGASYLTRVTFLGTTPPTQQFTGDPDWDDVATTFADSPLDAARALTPSLRKLLLAWNFQGHIEVRQGGLLLHVAGMQPTPQDYERLAQWVPPVLEKALKERR